MSVAKALNTLYNTALCYPWAASCGPWALWCCPLAALCCSAIAALTLYIQQDALNPHFIFRHYAPILAEQLFSGVVKVLFLSPLSALVISGVHVLCRDNFWYWETVVLVQTLGLVAAQVFAIALDGFFQLTITLLILVTGGLALAHCHPFEQEGPQVVQVCTVMLQAGPAWFCANRNNSYQCSAHPRPINA